MNTPNSSAYRVCAASCAHAISVLLFVVGSSAWAGTPIAITPSAPGINFVQVDFVYQPEFSDLTGVVISNANTGEINIQSGTLLGYLGRAAGVINVFTPTDGWVVHNLPVSTNFPYPEITTAFKLPPPQNGTPVPYLQAYVELDDSPITYFSGGSPYTWNVGREAFNGGGANGELLPGVILYPPPPGMIIISTNIGGGLVQAQPSHPNVQAAMNQCWPCAVANSLQWLENTYGILVPHDNIPGIGITAAAGWWVQPTNSLPGQLDQYMQRQQVQSRVNGGVTKDFDALCGKLAYLSANGLSDVVVKHQSITFGTNFFTNGMVSAGFAKPTFGFILSEILNGADVEVSYGPTDSGHAVDLVAAGYDALGTPYVMYVSDHLQTQQGDPNDNQGTLSVDYSRITEDTNGLHFADGKDHRVDSVAGLSINSVFSQSPGPTMLNSKWCQLPGYRLFLNNTNKFGADRASSFNWSTPANRAAIADDFRSDGRPFVAVRWWGSYLNNHNPGDEDGFVLSFLTDLQVTNNFSRPTNLLATYVVPWNRLAVLTNTAIVGQDGYPIYEYCAFLRDSYLYYVAPSATNVALPWSFRESSNTVYWLAIDAERGRSFVQTNGSWTNFPSGRADIVGDFWGWHTSPCSNLDVSVNGKLTATLAYANWTTNSVASNELEQAFALLTYASSPLPKLACTNWFQRPDRSCSGVAVLATDGTASPIVADDFQATRPGAISSLVLWGAWQDDRYDPSAWFRLRVYSDTHAANGYPSQPGNLLMEKLVLPLPTNVLVTGDATFWTASVVASNLCESFWDPTKNLGWGTTTRDSKVYQYNFYLSTNNAANLTSGQIYWLSVTALNTTNRFGWKSALTNDHFLDDATFGTQTNPPALGWTDLHYPPNHPFSTQTLDMAFALKMNEVDWFGTSTGIIVVTGPGLTSQGINLSGVLLWSVDAGPEGETTETNGYGMDVVETEMICLNLSGTCPLGTCALRVRDPSKAPGLHSLGQIAEQDNLMPGFLDLPPFAPSGAADSFFDVFTEIQVGTNVLHNLTPIHLGGVITAKPPRLGEHHDFAGPIPLFDETGATTSFSLQSLSYTAAGPAALQPPPTINCTNRLVECGAWTPIPPWAWDNNCNSNLTCVLVSAQTNGACPWTVSLVWKATDCAGQTNTCTQTVTVNDTTAPVIVCATNKTVQCGLSWAFDLPAASDTCCGTNVTVVILSTVTNGACPLNITRIWKAYDCCANWATCTQVVTVVDTTVPAITCATDKTVSSGLPWSFDPPSVIDACCGTNYTLSFFDVTNSLSPLTVTRTWKAINCCNLQSSPCSQTVTVTGAGTLPVLQVTQSGALPSQAAALASALGIPPEGYTLDNGQVSFIDPTNFISVPTIAVTDPGALSNLNCTTASEIDLTTLSSLMVLNPSTAVSKTVSALAAAGLTPQYGTPLPDPDPDPGVLLLSYTNTDSTVVSNTYRLDTSIGYQFIDPTNFIPLVGPGAQVQVHYAGRAGFIDPTNVSRLHYAARQTQRGPSVLLVPAGEASNRAAVYYLGLNPTITPQLIYYCPPLSVSNCAFIVPHYWCSATHSVTNPVNGQVTTADLMPVLIPATDDPAYVATAILTASTNASGQVVASVVSSGGMPPYSYLWSGSSAKVATNTGPNVAYTPVARVVQPQLACTRSNSTTCTLSWTDATGAFTLQSATSLRLRDWAPDTHTVVSNSGVFSVTVNLSESATRFFRLSLPGGTLPQTETVGVTVMDANGVSVSVQQSLGVQATVIPLGSGGGDSWGTESPYCPGLANNDTASWTGAMAACPGAGAQAFCWTDGASWAGDFIDPPTPHVLPPNPMVNGCDDVWNWGVDSADITLYIGHGAPDHITFTATANLFYNNAKLPRSWGDDAATNYNKAVWLGFLSCSVMQWDWIDAAGVHHTCIQRWSLAFDGLHIMLGFKSPAGVATGFPRSFANRMLGCPAPAMTIVDAWFNAAAACGTGTPAAMGPAVWVWVTTPAPAHWALVTDFGDHYWGKGPVGPTIRWWQVAGWWYL